MAGKQERDAESVRSFVLRASLMYVMFSRLPELTTLFEGLRYHMEVRRSALFGELPLITLSAPFKTIRPNDDLLLRAEQFTGSRFCRSDGREPGHANCGPAAGAGLEHSGNSELTPKAIRECGQNEQSAQSGLE